MPRERRGARRCGKRCGEGRGAKAASGGAHERVRGARRLCISSDSFFELRDQPRKALVVGAGYIAVELASILSGLGTDTTLSCRGHGVLRHGFDSIIQTTINVHRRP